MLTHQENELPIFVYGTLMLGERNYIEILHENLEHHESASVKRRVVLLSEGRLSCISGWNSYGTGTIILC